MCEAGYRGWRAGGGGRKGGRGICRGLLQGGDERLLIRELFFERVDFLLMLRLHLAEGGLQRGELFLNGRVLPEAARLKAGGRREQKDLLFQNR